MTRSVLLTVLFASVSFSQITLQEVEIKAKRELLTPMDVMESFAKDPGEALSRMAGVWKLRKGSIANDVVIRGFQRANINLLFDGVRIYAACPNRMDPPAFHIDFSEVKEIEVVKGGFDVRNYGSLGGVVNIRTEEPPKGFSTRLNLSTGSFSYFNPSARVSYADDRFSVLAGYSYRFSKPYRDGRGKRFTEYVNYREKDTTAFRVNTAWAKIGFTPTKDSKLELSYTAQRARDVLYPYLMMDSPKDDADRIRLGLELGNVRISLYNSRVDHLMNNSKRTSSTFMETRAKTNTYGLKGEFLLKRDILVGIEAFNWNWKAKTTMMDKSQNTIPDVDLRDLGIFLEYKRTLSSKLTLSAGIRLDTTRTKASKGLANTRLYRIYHNTESTSKTDTYPSGNIQISYRPSKALKLFAGIAYSVRVPDAQERYFALNRMGSLEKKLGDWVGNPKLKPSKNREIDVGVEWSSGRLNVKAELFYSSVKDYIVLYKQEATVRISSMMDANTYARSYANVNARILGGELKGSYAITDTLFLLGSLSYVRGTKNLKAHLGIKDKDLAEIPPLRADMSLRYDNGRFFFQVEGVLSASQSNVDSDLGEGKTSGYGVINLKAGGSYKGIRITAGVENLLDKFYYEHLSYLRDPFSSGVKVPEPGRSLYLSLSYSF